jgi:hypothetical protein
MSAGTPNWRFLLGSDVAGAQFAFDDAQPLRPLAEGLSAIPATIPALPTPRPTTNSATAVRAPETLTITATHGTKDVRFRTLRGNVDFKNQTLGGAWSPPGYPNSRDPLWIYAIEIHPAGSL